MTTMALHGLVSMTNDEYHAAPGISNSHLTDISRTPEYYYAKRLDPNREPEEVTEAKLIGTATHAAILEPDLFESRFVAAPEGIDRRTKAGKEAYEEFKAEALGKVILPAKGYKKCLAMRDAVYRHPVAKKFLSHGQSEQTFFATDPETGELIKCRVDKRHDSGLNVDVKTCRDASPNGFAREMVQWRYYGQDPWYVDLQYLLFGERPPFVFVAVEKEPPYLVGVYFLEEEDREYGRRENRRLLNLLIECKRTNTWPGYCTEHMPIALPSWFKRQMEQADMEDAA